MKRVTGVERSWSHLKRQFNRQGPGPDEIGVRFFETISKDGPQLFAVTLDKRVYYHDEDKWQGYETAKDVEFGTMESSNFNPRRESSSEQHHQELERLSVEESHDSLNSIRTNSTSSQN
ncbi:unnamed protein product [Didymodactylos carnosus]|uniref:Uncharacterized protein n=1 Tax=Didymodactylos carnosus TaxID=1234261 RepID=A0A8S2I587_9BILA|nr:unnamed protein product [Didymodactylos carnosus]CAF3719343.1 unnamed protein product [Didymodactylos carnosus]